MRFSLLLAAALAMQFNLHAALRYHWTISLESTNPGPSALYFAEKSVQKCEGFWPNKKCRYETVFQKGFSSPTEDGAHWLVQNVDPEMRREIHYQDVVTLKNLGTGTYLGTEKNGTVSSDRKKADVWKQWTLINPNKQDDDHAVQEGMPMALKSVFDKYLTAENNNTGLSANGQTIGTPQKWTVKKQ